jgi:hypothetical protein
VGRALWIGVVALALSAGAAVTPVTPPAAANPRIDYGVDGWARVLNSDEPGSASVAFKNLHTLGVTWIRVEVNWGDIEKTRGHCDWRKIDQAAYQASVYNIKIMAVLLQTPTWARPAGAGETYPSTTPTELGYYGKFVTAFANRYTKPGRASVKAVEVWNEPNVPGSWAGVKTGARYVNLLKTAYKAVKAVNPATTVVTGGLAPACDSSNSVNARTFVINLYKAGGRPFFNAIGMHPYTFPNKPSDHSPRGWGAMTIADGGKPSMRTTMIANGDGAKKIWNTEFGSPASIVGATKQAAIATDAVREWNKYSFAGPFFYMCYRDMSQSRWAGMGLIRDDGSPYGVRRPVFNAYKSAIAAAKAG